MNRQQLPLLLCFLTFFNFNILAEDEDADTEQKNIQVINGQVVIELEQESQTVSGLKSQQFKPIKFQKEFIAYGKAISITPLLTLRSQYQTALSKQAGAKARLSKAEATIARLRRLHKNETVSTRKLQTQQSQWLSDSAIFNELSHKSTIIINNSILQWGATITHWVTDLHSAQFKKLLATKSTLLTLTLPAKNFPLTQVDNIVISPTGDRENAFKAYFVSKLPMVDSLSQGLQYSFLTDDPHIQPGMNFTAWIPQQNTQYTGIIIPESALAWHLGQSFVFIKIDDEHFIHKNISQPIKVAKGYFIAETLADNEEVVVTGTQMLLSHEFRSQIPDEDDD